MRDRGSLGQGIESCKRHDFFHISICLQTDLNLLRSKGECIADQSSLVVTMGMGKKRVKGSIPARVHRKRVLAKRSISRELLKIEHRFWARLKALDLV